MNYYTPKEEVKSRLKRFKELFGKYLSQCEGALIFSRLNIYYFSGTFANGVFWIPKEGDPILFCRRGIERAQIESPLENIVQFNSYGDIKNRFIDLNVSMPSKIAVEMNGLPWSLSNSLKKHLSDNEFVPCDKLVAICRAKKSEWELELIREGGRRHNKCLTEILPAFLHEGINELQISHKISEIYFSEGNNGPSRMETFGEDAFLGHISAGESANYSSFFNGPVGLRGVHPAAPFMGSEEIKWEPGNPLTIDTGFMYGGYMTDKTHVFWLGNKKSIPENVHSAHDFCVEIQNMTAEQLKPGVKPSDLWKKCEENVFRSSWVEGFMGLGNNKVKFLGHGIGLAIDETPVITEGFDLPLEEGMTLAIEPKIGIPGLGMVGIENTFEVTKNGGKQITGENYEIITI